MKNKFILFLNLILLFSLTSCSFAFGNVQDLLAPPKPSGSQLELIAAIEEAEGAPIALVPPSTGTVKNAIIYKDLNRDGISEAVVIYSLKSDNLVRIKVLCKGERKKWHVLYNIEGYGNYINFISVKDLNNDGKTELITGWQIAQNEEKGISIDTITANETKRIYSGVYSSIKLITEYLTTPLLVLCEKTEVNYQVRLLDVKEGQANIISVIPLNEKIKSIEQITFGKSSDNEYSLFIDSLYADENYATSCITFKSIMSDEAYNPENQKTENLTIRQGAIMCKDADDDGKIEIPRQTALLALDQNLQQRLMLTQFCRYTQGRFQVKRQEIISINEGFSIVFKQEYKDKVTAYKNNLTQGIEFCYYYYQDDSLYYEKLFSINSYTKEEYNSLNITGTYTLLKQKEDKIIAVQYFTPATAEAKQYIIQPNELKELISLY